MSLKTLLRSPPPSAVWSLDDDLVAVVRATGAEQIVVRSTATPVGAVELGPVGMQSVDPARMGAAIGELNAQIRGTRRPGVVLPTRWTRCHLLEFTQLPRRHGELEEVVRWRLKKLLPVAPTDLRLAVVHQPTEGSTHRVLCSAVLERACAGLESAFTEAGLEPGLITARLLAVASGDGRGQPTLTVLQERGQLGLFLMVDGGCRLLRTKSLPREDGPWGAVQSELGLTIGYIREKLEEQRELLVQVTSESEGAGEALRGWFAQQEAMRLQAPVRPLTPDRPEAAAALGQGRLSPVTRLLGGGGS